MKKRPRVTQCEDPLRSIVQDNCSAKSLREFISNFESGGQNDFFTPLPDLKLDQVASLPASRREVSSLRSMSVAKQRAVCMSTELRIRSTWRTGCVVKVLEIHSGSGGGVPGHAQEGRSLENSPGYLAEGGVERELTIFSRYHIGTVDVNVQQNFDVNVKI